MALIAAAHRLNALVEAQPTPHTRAALVAHVGVLARATAVYALLAARSEAVIDLAPILQAQRASSAWRPPQGSR